MDSLAQSLPTYKTFETDSGPIHCRVWQDDQTGENPWTSEYNITDFLLSDLCEHDIDYVDCEYCSRPTRHYILYGDTSGCGAYRETTKQWGIKNVPYYACKALEQHVDIHNRTREKNGIPYKVGKNDVRACYLYMGIHYLYHHCPEIKEYRELKERYNALHAFSLTKDVTPETDLAQELAQRTIDFFPLRLVSDTDVERVDIELARETRLVFWIESLQSLIGGDTRSSRVLILAILFTLSKQACLGRKAKQAQVQFGKFLIAMRFKMKFLRFQIECLEEEMAEFLTEGEE